MSFAPKAFFGESMRATLGQIMALTASLLCDKCLAMTEKDRDTPISDFCARCRHKLAYEFPEMLHAQFPPEDQDSDPTPEDWEAES